MASIQKSIGNSLVVFGDVLSKNILKWILTLSSGVIGAIIDINKSKDFMFDGAIDTILITLRLVAVAVIVAAVVFISVNLISDGFKRLGKYLIHLSQIARFSYKIIPQVEKYQKAEYFIEFSNKEWFSDAVDVKSSIGIAGTTNDLEDKLIASQYEKSRQSKFVPSFIEGKWISEEEHTVRIPRRKSKTLRFLKVNIVKDEFEIIGNENVSLYPRKYIFPFSVYGKTKEGSFSVQFQVLVIYKGKDEIDVKINGDGSTIAEVVSENKNKALWT